jgi:hypothetical protein
VIRRRPSSSPLMPAVRSRSSTLGVTVEDETRAKSSAPAGQLAYGGDVYSSIGFTFAQVCLFALNSLFALN